jgi:hypothetical protein
MLTVEREPNTASPFINAVLAFRDQKQDKKQREAASPSKPATPLPDGSMNPIAAVNEADLEEYIIALGYELQDNGKYLHPKSASGRAGISLFYKDGKQRSYSHHSKTTDPLADGNAHDLCDWRVQYEHGGDRNAALRAFGAEFTTEEGLTFNEHNLRLKKAARVLKIEDLDSGRPKKQLIVDAITIEHKKPDYIIDGIMERGTLVSLNGAPGSCKSFTALDLGLCTATGTPWCGRAVSMGAVLVVLGEGHSGYKRRIDAWYKHHGLEMQPDQLYLTVQALPLADTGESVKLLIEKIHELPRKPTLVIVDTLARNYGSDENSATDMSRFVNHLGLLSTEFGSAVLCVHHTGLTDKLRGRGSSVKQGAADAEYLMTMKNGIAILSNTKMKDSPPPEPTAFRLEQITLDGEGTTSAVLVPANGPVCFAEVTPEELTDTQRDVLRVLTEKIGLRTDGLPVDVWRDAVVDGWQVAKPSVKRKSLVTKFARVLESLVKVYAVAVNGDRAFPSITAGGDQ